MGSAEEDDDDEIAEELDSRDEEDVVGRADVLEGRLDETAEKFATEAELADKLREVREEVTTLDIVVELFELPGEREELAKVLDSAKELECLEGDDVVAMLEIEIERVFALELELGLPKEVLDEVVFRICEDELDDDELATMVDASETTTLLAPDVRTPDLVEFEDNAVVKFKALDAIADPVGVELRDDIVTEIKLVVEFKNDGTNEDDTTADTLFASVVIYPELVEVEIDTNEAREEVEFG